jgi:carbon dioxide concentrating mechanism protein CcmN
MYLPPLQPNHNPQTCVSGDVVIHSSAAIAPGVLLQADPDHRITIAAGVCIGMGTVLHASGGSLEVGEGANIGAGVLIIGKGGVGANACIGSASTLFNTTVAAMQVVPPGSLLGDTSRPAATATEETTTEAEKTAVVESPVVKPSMPVVEPSQPEGDGGALGVSSPEASLTYREEKSSQEIVYGKAHLNRLLSTLLPHRQSLNHSLPDNQSPADGS